MEIVRKLPNKIVKEAEPIYKYYHYNYTQASVLPPVLLSLTLWGVLPSIFIIWIWLYKKRGAKLLKEYYPKYWSKLRLVAAINSITGILVNVLVLQGKDPSMNYLSWQSLVTCLAAIAVIVAIFVTSEGIGEKIELAFYKSKGYDYRGHLGSEL